MNEFDVSIFHEMTLSEMTSLIDADFRQAYCQPVCVRGYLRVMHWVSFLCADEQAPPTILIQGPLVCDALRAKVPHQYGGSTLFEGPCTIWTIGFKDGEIPGFSIQIFQPVRIQFASHSHPNEPVTVDLPQPTSDKSTVEILGRGELCSLIRLEERFSTAMLLERPGWIGDCFEQADEIHRRIFELWMNLKANDQLHELVAKSNTLRDMLQMIFRDYERFLRDHNLPLPFGRSIADQKNPTDEFWK